MTDAARDLVVSILQQCAASAPQPWHAAEFARLKGIPWEHVECCLDLLGEAGLVRGAAGQAGAVVLTAAGSQLIQNPQALDRFCAGQDLELPPEGADPADASQRRAIRQTLRTPPRPLATRLLVWANLLVFAFGLYLAARKNLAFEFLMPYRLNGAGVGVVQNKTLDDIFRTTGRLDRADFLRGHWWRLLACCFVHFGLIHLVMNLYALRIVGEDVEALWGPWRTLVLYLLAALGGSCAALTTAPAVVGASGAICGLLAALAVWVLLNRRYLRRQAVRRQMRNLLLTGLLIGLISLAPGVSGAGHLGGAVVGAVAAVFLHYQRFGGAVARGLAVLGLLALPAGCLVGLQKASTRWPAGAATRTVAITENRLWKIDARVRDFQLKQLSPLLEQHARRRDDRAVRQALADLPGHISQFRETAQLLDDLGRQRSKQAEETRQAAADYFRTRADFMEAARRALAEGRTWTDPDDLDGQTIRAKQRWRKARAGGQ